MMQRGGISIFTVKLADIPVEIDNRFGSVEELCRDYVVSPLADEPPAFRVSVTSQQLQAYRQTCGRPMTVPQAESALLYMEICGRMPAYDALLLHAAVVSVDGCGYAFSAPRGTGKTTHMSLWRQTYGKRVIVVNGDKPLVRRAQDGHWWAYGTPWCGKEGEQTNTRCPLCALCFLEQGTKNEIVSSPVSETVTKLLEGTMLPRETAMQDRMAALVGALTRDIPAFSLRCLPDQAAAQLAYVTFEQIRNSTFRMHG